MLRRKEEKCPAKFKRPSFTDINDIIEKNKKNQNYDLIKEISLENKILNKECE